MTYLSEDLENKMYEEFIESLIIKKTIKTPLPSITPSLLADGYAIIKRHDQRVNEILINTNTYVDIKKLGDHLFDPITNLEILKKGQMAYLWGACIIVSEKIPDNTILLLSEPRYKLCTILKTRESKYAQELLIQTAELRKLASDLVKRADQIDRLIYEITKKEE